VSRPSKKRDPVSIALAELRRRLGDSQQSFSNRMGVSLPTVARWETTSRPTGASLHMLESIARSNGHEDLALEFARAFETLQVADPRKAVDLHLQRMRWAELDTAIGEIQEAAQRLQEAVKPESKMKCADLQKLVAEEGKKIYDQGSDMWIAREAIRVWAWRNRR
jgi:transcriptional regulator with XRE-family HTH domain